MAMPDRIPFNSRLYLDRLRPDLVGRPSSGRDVGMPP